jgi:hypothetical protein
MPMMDATPNWSKAADRHHDRLIEGSQTRGSRRSDAEAVRIRPVLMKEKSCPRE